FPDGRSVVVLQGVSILSGNQPCSRGSLEDLSRTFFTVLPLEKAVARRHRTSGRTLECRRGFVLSVWGECPSDLCPRNNAGGTAWGDARPVQHRMEFTDITAPAAFHRGTGIEPAPGRSPAVALCSPPAYGAWCHLDRFSLGNWLGKRKYREIQA